MTNSAGRGSGWPGQAPLLKLIVAFLISLVAAPSWAQTSPETIEVVDVAGRTVRLHPNPERIILGEGRHLYAIAALDRDNPFRRIVGWASDLRKNDGDAWAKYQAKFPEAEKVADIGDAGDPISVEQVITLKAQLVVLDLGNSYFDAKQTGLVEKLEKAGIAVVFIDFRDDPTENAVPSMTLLGRLLAREKEAQAFNDFALKQNRLVYDRVGSIDAKDRPLVFIERGVGYDPTVCCLTYGPANFGKYVENAGGRNWGNRHFSGSGTGGTANPEQIFTDNPDYYVLTTANWAVYRPQSTGVPLGYEATQENVQPKLKALLDRPGFSELKAVKAKKVLAIFHQFYDSPYYFVAVQALAKEFYPDRFTDVDPVATFRELHEQFLPIEYSGFFWTSVH